MATQGNNQDVLEFDDWSVLYSHADLNFLAVDSHGRVFDSIPAGYPLQTLWSAAQEFKRRSMVAQEKAKQAAREAELLAREAELLARDDVSAYAWI